MTDRPTFSAPFSVRDAMRRAGVPNWQMGGGVSSADAIDFIAKQRDDFCDEITRLNATRCPRCTTVRDIAISALVMSVVIIGATYVLAFFF